MVIEIAPKQKINTVSLSLVVGLAIIVIFSGALSLSYYYFYSHYNDLSQKIEEKEQLSSSLIKDIADEEAKILPVKDKISDFAFLISSHRTPVNIFGAIEKNCLPDVWFPGLNFNFGNKEASLLGSTKDFSTLEQQIFVLKQEPLFEKITLSDVKLAEKGGVDFLLKIVFKNEVFNQDF